MIDYGHFCYLDVQKTGSTFIRRFLREHCAFKPVRANRHGPVAVEHVDPSCFYFISTRHPVALYRSLYAYGCLGEGGIYRRLQKLYGHEVQRFYSGDQVGFERWLAVVASPGDGPDLAKDYRAALKSLIGPLSFRYLHLALPDPNLLHHAATRDDITACYAGHKLSTSVIRTETLNHDLAQLVSNQLRPHLRDVDAALAVLRDEDRRHNVSGSTQGKYRDLVSPKIEAVIAEREWFLMDVMGYRSSQ